ncbi:aminodeoxychorismate synthase component I [Paraburkholderia caballeronis]|uniref:Para-aminobenzoate synthetase / 4-amino-4-deoxychorismate lyase n=1 Tax=Paraburkholderia caballeronis TaxID=416943 RepID=A0A1H7QXM4_9BURK|nr:aminodeoxychorismate synthase component I [Paraburkholderia caballeronis]PXW23760.1 para-aminobenzoate synthetase/4-amino-4-deoxychorismate lyase [Paraburkholderia caballeronis]PXW99101.1 para-aminobenzoate synthetase/4-amino-4-deoxychorismate lyase [Paraburkholderia caballeronis]RAJ96307.1 para-aminobenzoate synthetase/4-amino-4-deoxychorismate lyase [Paraburkholderia caballeronis]SEC87660.1 para-aminobenzoate synthetase / 4-amino-4-deoxychorismate lyase [Paraburkholderia caballeronis]SEL5
MAVDDGGAIFALLDDSDSTDAGRSSRLYTGFVRERAASDPADLDALCAAVDADLRGGLFAVVLGDYEFGRNLQFGTHGTDTAHTTQRGDAALRFLLFSRCEKLSRDEASAWLAQRDGGAGGAAPAPAGIAQLQAGVDRAQFEHAIDAVHDALRAGESYQINYTYRLYFDVFGTPLALYRRLRERQRVRYGALIALPGDRWVLSCSPELFVEKHGDTLRARPMKGTAARSADPADDRGAADFLAHDPKNRAENVMIVDLLRNDLSRIARTGSVHVPALFSIEPYASVWQMTSTIEATLRARASFADVMRALFPCGSITGAPKHRTMQLIDALEHGPRGLYTGAIGWLDAAAEGDAACGDFCLSVAIRTLTLDAADAGSMRRGVMGIGAGIVLDSVAADEYDECRLKARFLTEADPGVELFETMYATRADGVRHLERHLARLAAGAAWFGFRYDDAALRARIAAQCDELPDGAPSRLRVALAKNGEVQLTAAPLAPLAEGPVGVLLAPDHGFANVHSADALLLRKTTRRAEFDRAWREAEAQRGFDMLFFNERGELTEGGRSNVFVKIEGRWWTPPLSSGLLPGVMRGVLLDDAAFAAGERVLARADVLNAEALLICNALRGALPARLI